MVKLCQPLPPLPPKRKKETSKKPNSNPRTKQEQHQESVNFEGFLGLAATISSLGPSLPLFLAASALMAKKPWGILGCMAFYTFRVDKIFSSTLCILIRIRNLLITFGFIQTNLSQMSLQGLRVRTSPRRIMGILDIRWKKETKAAVK